MRKILSITLCIALLLSTCSVVFGDNGAGNKEIKLTLEDAMNQVSNSTELKLLDKKIEISNKKYIDAIDASNDAAGAPSHSQAESLKLAKDEKLNWRLASLDLESLKKQREDKLQELKDSVKSEYYNVLFLQKDLKIYEDEIKNTDIKIKQLEAKIKLGQAKELDLKSLQVQKMNLQGQVNDYNRQIYNSKLNIKKLLGIDLATNITLEELEIPFVSFDSANIEDRINKAVENNFAINMTTQQINLKDLERELIKEYTQPDDSNSIYALDLEIEELKAQQASDILNLKQDLWMEYYDLQILEENITLEELNLEIAQLNYESIMTKAKMGAVDSATELNAEITYNSQKNTYQRAMYNYILAAEQLNEKLK